MHQNGENLCKSGNDCVSLLQTEGEINSEENTEKPEELEVFSLTMSIMKASQLVLWQIQESVPSQPKPNNWKH